MTGPTRIDIFEPGDQTALVCVDVPAMQNLITEQLTELGYKIHTGFSADDFVLKLRAHIYDIVIISEHFGGTNAATNPLLGEAIQAPALRRLKQFLVLIGSTLTTNDEMEAFFYSVDLVVGLADMVHLRPLLRRSLARAEEFYRPLNEVLQSTGMA
jgi:hypothetical protein